MAQWDSERIFDKANSGKIPFDKDRIEKVIGMLAGVGAPKDSGTDKVINVAVQPRLQVGEKEYKYTFSVNKNNSPEKQKEYREKMLEKGYVEQAPVFLKIKYDPSKSDMYALLKEMTKYDPASGKKSFNAISAQYTVIEDKDKDGTPRTTDFGKPLTSNFASTIFMSYPPEREAEFKAITAKHIYVELGVKDAAPVAAKAETAYAAPVAESAVEEYGLDDADIPF
jgi:hypothetical protein